MHDDDVSDGEMRWRPPDRDEIDLIFREDDFVDDVADVAAVVHDLRSAYLPNAPLARSEALQSFTGAHLRGRGEPPPPAAHRSAGSETQLAAAHFHGEPREGNRSVFTALGATLAGIAGKVLLATTVAAAGVGGLHVAGVVDVPGLPDQANERALDARDLDVPPVEVPAASEPEATEPEATEPEPTEPESTEPDSGGPSDFAMAMQEWSDCVAGAAAQRGLATADTDAAVDTDAAAAPPGPFDPEAACGPLPALFAHPNAGRPAEIEERIAAVRAWADCVADNAPDHAEVCGRNPAAAENAAAGGPPADVPGNGPQNPGPPADVPGNGPQNPGPPADVPGMGPANPGPPADVPADRPENPGPPAHVPGPPANPPGDGGPPANAGGNGNEDEGPPSGTPGRGGR